MYQRLKSIVFFTLVEDVKPYHTHRHTDTRAQTDRQTDSQTDRQANRDRDRQTDADFHKSLLM